jgi:hypothetical protein
MLLKDGAPVTENYQRRHRADHRDPLHRQRSGCPDWRNNSDTNFGNGTSHNMAVRWWRNLAAMVADRFGEGRDRQQRNRCDEFDQASTPTRQAGQGQ